MGYSTRLHLLLDLDNTTVSKSILLTKDIIRLYPYVGKALILQSSTRSLLETWLYIPERTIRKVRKQDCYHVVFDNKIGYNTCDRILRELTGLQVFSKIADKLRGLRRCMTLRISPKIKRDGIDPCPMPLILLDNIYTSKVDSMIEVYLQYLRMAYQYFQDSQLEIQHLYHSQTRTQQLYQLSQAQKPIEPHLHPYITLHKG